MSHLTSSDDANLAPDVRAEVLALLQAPDKDGLVRLLSTSMGNVTESKKSKAILAFVGVQMQILAETSGAAYLDALSEVVSSLNALRDVVFGREQYILLISLAKSWMALQEFRRAAEVDVRILHAPPNMERNVLPVERLECIMRLLRSVEHTDDAAVTEDVLFHAMPQYRRVCRQLSAEPPVDDLHAVLVSFLEAVAVALQRRGLLVEASRAFTERYGHSGDGFDFERAAACAILAETSPQRARLVEALHLAPESRALGELGDVLTKVFHVQMLERRDVAALLRCRAVAAGNVPEDAVRTAVNQHNIMAIFKVFDNISFAALAKKLDGVRSEDVGGAVAKMVSEERLKAKVDQATQWVTFHVPDSAAAMMEWDNKLGGICDAVSHATELLMAAHPELRHHLQEAD